MSNSKSSIRCGLDIERSVTGPFTGTFQNLGSALDKNPIIATFDNQSTVAVEVSGNGSDVWKTFSAGEALVLDLRANHGQPHDFSFPLGMQFTVRATGGTGSFRLSIIYAE